MGRVDRRVQELSQKEDGVDGSSLNLFDFVFSLTKVTILMIWTLHSSLHNRSLDMNYDRGLESKGGSFFCGRLNGTALKPLRGYHVLQIMQFTHSTDSFRALQISLISDDMTQITANPRRPSSSGNRCPHSEIS